MAVAELTTEQNEAHGRLLATFAEFIQALQDASATGLDPAAAIGNHLRENMGDLWDEMPAHLRMLL